MPNDRIRLPKNTLSPWDNFRRALFESIQAIEGRYFYLDRYEAPGAWRERIYCYELYHQLRSRLPENFPYILHGEIDKRGHENIRQHFDTEIPNPDFVVHRPGTEKNLVVIEVKSENSSQKKIDHDIKKLRVFTDSVGYEHGIMLFFGPLREWHWAGLNEKTQVIWHEQVGLKPRVIVGSQTDWEF